jgi:hypothetical protein
MLWLAASSNIFKLASSFYVASAFYSAVEIVVTAGRYTERICQELQLKPWVEFFRCHITE